MRVCRGRRRIDLKSLRLGIYPSAFQVCEPGEWDRIKKDDAAVKLYAFGCNVSHRNAEKVYAMSMPAIRSNADAQGRIDAI